MNDHIPDEFDLDVRLTDSSAGSTGSYGDEDTDNPLLCNGDETKFGCIETEFGCGKDPQNPVSAMGGCESGIAFDCIKETEFGCIAIPWVE
jgi:hypothetical protein